MSVKAALSGAAFCVEKGYCSKLFGRCGLLCVKRAPKETGGVANSGLKRLDIKQSRADQKHSKLLFIGLISVLIAVQKPHFHLEIDFFPL